MTTKKPGTSAIASFQAPGGKRRQPLPTSPDVDEEGLARAEKEMYGEKGRAGRTTEARLPRRERRARHKKSEATVYIRGPQPVVDAFNAFKEKHGYDNAWSALEELLLAYGEPIEDFEV